MQFAFDPLALPDFRLQPRDIIYVGKSLGFTVGQMLDTAISSYLYAIIVTWIGQNYEPITDEPYIPGL